MVLTLRAGRADVEGTPRMPLLAALATVAQPVLPMTAAGAESARAASICQVSGLTRSRADITRRTSCGFTNSPCPSAQ